MVDGPQSMVLKMVFRKWYSEIVMITMDYGLWTIDYRPRTKFSH